MSRRTVVLIALIALPVVAFFGAVPILIQRNLSIEGVEARAAALVGRPVSVEKVEIAFRPALRIRAEGVVIDGGGSADAIEVELAILPLLRRKIEPAELHLKGARFPVERGPDGRLRLLHRENREGPSKAPSNPSLPALEAIDGEIFLVGVDGKPADVPVLKIVDLKQARLEPGGRARNHLVVSLEPGSANRFAIGRLRLDGVVALEDGEVSVESGRAKASDLVLRGLRFATGEGRFTYASGRLGIEGLIVSGYEGIVAFEGSAHLGRPHRIDGELEASRLDLAGLVGDWRGQPMERSAGTLGLEGRVELFSRSVGRGTGRGTVEIRGGALPAGSLFGTLLGGIGRLTGQLISSGSLGKPRPSQVEFVTATWELRDDRFHTEDLAVATDDYRYVGSGSLGLDQTLIFSGRLQLTNRGAQRMLANASLPGGSGARLIPEIPLDVGGRLGAATFDSHMAGLPTAAKSALGGLTRGGGRVVGGAVGVGKKILGR
ncbi:MAG: hypothetical protein JRH10_05240 [Deltaproteobacteria bacterium]|nr:hypothetical protein [Deltaproteobacteria bacterium]MBW2444496.1 hypothetical protein [Deltaproteobacteria bacterium]